MAQLPPRFDVPWDRGAAALRLRPHPAGAVPALPRFRFGVDVAGRPVLRSGSAQIVTGPTPFRVVPDVLDEPARRPGPGADPGPVGFPGAAGKPAVPPATDQGTVPDGLGGQIAVVVDNDAVPAPGVDRVVAPAVNRFVPLDRGPVWCVRVGAGHFVTPLGAAGCGHLRGRHRGHGPCSPLTISGPAAGRR